MKISALLRIAAAALLVHAGLFAAHLCAQEQVHIGRFLAVLEADAAGRDRSFAIMFPQPPLAERTPAGIALWACGGDSAGLSGGLSLGLFGTEGASRRVSLRFDQEKPDTLLLDGEWLSTLWYVREQDIVPVLRRAVQADSLSIQLLDTVASFGPAVFTYHLAGMDSVLKRLGCPIAPPAAGRLSGRDILRSRIPGGFPAPEGVPPRPADTRAMLAYVERNYPAAQRAARVEGEVVLRVRIQENGRVDPTGVRVVRSTSEAFDEVAIRAVRLLRFTPGGGAAEIPIRFTLPPIAPPARPPPRKCARAPTRAFAGNRRSLSS